MTSKPGERNVERVAADANVILSALVGKAALKVFTDSDVGVDSTESTLTEVLEYIPDMAMAYDMAPEALEGQFRLLSIREHSRKEYQGSLKEATDRIGERDPDDVDLLALAIHLEIPVWSNDNDFENCGVEWYTTAELLKRLGI